jgi:hypothetical protein
MDVEPGLKTSREEDRLRVFKNRVLVRTFVPRRLKWQEAEQVS